VPLMLGHPEMVLIAAYQALFLEGGMKKGQNVLVHAVGLIEIARELD